MKRQEMFDKAATGMLRQGKPCWNSSLKCAYGNEEGMHCAVGFLIPEGHPAMAEKVGIIGLTENHPDLLKVWGETVDTTSCEPSKHPRRSRSHWMA